MEINGKIKMIGESQTFGASGFTKRETVVTTEDQYPQHILIEFVQDKVGLLDNFSVGQPVKIGVNLRGREWINPQGETKYFNTIQGWRIEAQGNPQARNQSAVNTYDAQQKSGPENAGNEFLNLSKDEEDDLPF